MRDFIGFQDLLIRSKTMNNLINGISKFKKTSQQSKEISYIHLNYLIQMVKTLIGLTMKRETLNIQNQSNFSLKNGSLLIVEVIMILQMNSMICLENAQEDMEPLFKILNGANFQTDLKKQIIFRELRHLLNQK
jgi:hypothetical protein